VNRVVWTVFVTLAIGLVGGDVLASKPLTGSAAPPLDRRRDAARRKAAATTSRPTPAPKPDSVGHPNDGRLVGGKRLDTSQPHLRLVPVYARGDVRWGLPSLVDMLDRASRAVAKKYPGSRLDVGDLSTRNGGEVGRHHSHESGRDADVGFYVVDAKGRQVHDGRFIEIGADLRATRFPGARFDVARNWLFVERLLLDPKAVVSHVFIAEPLRQALLAHAKRIGVSQRLRDRAAIALMQPTSALPHDDHMHVRISCPRDAHDRCVELAKNAPWKGQRGKGTKGLGVRSAQAHKPVAPLSRKRGGNAAVRSKQPPALSSSVEADADAFEVKDLLDDVGVLKITD
jgi:penicillin-insensitive murein endopeptidase